MRNFGREDIARLAPALRPVAERADLSVWNELAAKLQARLQAESRLSHDASLFSRVHGYYLPVLFWILETHRWHVTANGQAPVIIGLNAPQGAGKTTLTYHLVWLLGELGLRALTLSIDDFYLTRAEQVALARTRPANPYLESRGYPGTHDLALGARTLAQLKSLGAGETMQLPAYDKSLNRGQGDRRSSATWPSTEGPIDVALLEGWMLGFQPVPESCLPDRHFIEINQTLQSYHAWHEKLDAFLHLHPLEVENVIAWRIEAEERMKASGASGMSQDEIARYIAKFIPAYRTYLAPLAQGLSTRWPRSLVIDIGENRLPDAR